MGVVLHFGFRLREGKKTFLHKPRHDIVQQYLFSKPSLSVPGNVPWFSLYLDLSVWLSRRRTFWNPRGGGRESWRVVHIRLFELRVVASCASCCWEFL